MMWHVTMDARADRGYRHEAFLYEGLDQFMGGMLPFVRGALAAEEPILVVLPAVKLSRLRAALGESAERVLLADMAEVGENPARIIPAWQEFVDVHGGAGRRLWGVGEPIGPDRGCDELVECQRHEALLNLAFGDHDFTLLCPYDVGALDPAVIDEARRTHPFVSAHGVAQSSACFPGPDAFAAPFDLPLPAPPWGTPSVRFGLGTLGAVRVVVTDRAVAAGLSTARVADLVLAANELATNSVVHGGGSGSVRVWSETGAVVCEICDNGSIEDPLAGRRRPSAESIGGRGLWIANQLCELVQVRTLRSGSVVRLRMRLDGA